MTEVYPGQWRIPLHSITRLTSTKKKKKKIQIDSSLLLGERQEHGKRPGKAENLG